VTVNDVVTDGMGNRVEVEMVKIRCKDGHVMNEISRVRSDVFTMETAHDGILKGKTRASGCSDRPATRTFPFFASTSMPNFTPFLQFRSLSLTLKGWGSRRSRESRRCGRATCKKSEYSCGDLEAIIDPLMRLIER
jgi:hypothetical protein